MWDAIGAVGFTSAALLYAYKIDGITYGRASEAIKKHAGFYALVCYSFAIWATSNRC